MKARYREMLQCTCCGSAILFEETSLLQTLGEDLISAVEVRIEARALLGVDLALPIAAQESILFLQQLNVEHLIGERVARTRVARHEMPVGERVQIQN